MVDLCPRFRLGRQNVSLICTHGFRSKKVSIDACLCGLFVVFSKRWHLTSGIESEEGKREEKEKRGMREGGKRVMSKTSGIEG